MPIPQNPVNYRNPIIEKEFSHDVLDWTMSEAVSRPEEEKRFSLSHRELAEIIAEVTRSSRQNVSSNDQRERNPETPSTVMPIRKDISHYSTGLPNTTGFMSPVILDVTSLRILILILSTSLHPSSLPPFLDLKRK